jgi:hypothetical protein
MLTERRCFWNQDVWDDEGCNRILASIKIRQAIKWMKTMFVNRLANQIKKIDMWNRWAILLAFYFLKEKRASTTSVLSIGTSSLLNLGGPSGK